MTQLTLDGLNNPDNGSILDGIGRVVPTDLFGEMQRSYLEYAMSVIVGRALPDARDGLKPVHRRILYAMHELGLSPDRPFRKCARVVGDVLGKYHPHGDQSVYDALVRMVQSFSSRYPLVDGHGNFGSVDDDPAAAMRYTECRLASVGDNTLLSQISEEIVEFGPNFDGSQAEPLVLPARLPILLLNGSSGIAVGMATNVPPHNLGELVNGLLLLIDRPDCTLDDLLKKIPAPDFPTGAQIIDTTGIREAYATGRGTIPMRGITQVEEIQPGKGRHRRSVLVITELPFQTNKAALIKKIAELVNERRIEGIADIVDESDREGMRVVIELKRDAQPQTVLAQLHKLTPLQSNFGMILLALVNGEPRQLSLKEAMQAFLDFREDTLTRVFRSELAQTQRKAEDVAAMLLALGDLDRVITLLRNAPDGPTARHQLQDALGCSGSQADTILAMPLRRLTGMERQKLEQDHATLQARITELEGLLGDREQRLTYLKKELRDLRKTHGDPRRTQVVSAAQAEAEMEAMPAIDEGSDAPVLVQISRKGYIRRLTLARKGRKPASIRDLSGDDEVLQDLPATLQQELLTLTPSGKAYTLDVDTLPAATGQNRGIPLITLLPQPEPMVATLLLDPSLIESQDLVVLSRQGRIKRLEAKDFTGLTNRGSTVLKLKDDDELGWGSLVPKDANYAAIVATSGGRLLRLPLDDNEVPIMGRTAMGNQALRLHRKETIAGLALVKPTDLLILGSQQGYLKRLEVKAVALAHRGAIGTHAMPFKTKTDALTGILVLPRETHTQPTGWQVLLHRGETEGSVAVDLAGIPLAGSRDGGQQLSKPTKGETFSGLSLLAPQEDLLV